MTRVRCMQCGQGWQVHTLHPGNLGMCGIVCPDCISALPLLDVHLLRRSA
jgi:hypothetical protein